MTSRVLARLSVRPEPSEVRLEGSQDDLEAILEAEMLDFSTFWPRARLLC